jgi:hypothetical protein
LRLRQSPQTIEAYLRDPPAPKATNLSNGFTFTLCP